MRQLRSLLACLALSTACSAPSPEGQTLPSSVLPTTTTPAPEDPSRFAFAVKGDWGAGTSAQRAVNARICSQPGRVPFRDVLTVGDNFYSPDGVATTANFGSPERCLREQGLRYRATWGNHDVFGESTRTTLGARRWYRWTAPGIAFFMLDSTRIGSSTQRAWLAEQLRATREPVRIVAFHHPPFSVATAHEPDRAVRRSWVPLFEQYDVTLVLNGHQHVYEHLRVRGVDYVVTGGGGASLYGCGRVTAPAIRCRAAHHFLYVVVDGAQVRVRALGTRPGAVIDDFTIAA